MHSHNERRTLRDVEAEEASWGELKKLLINPPMSIQNKRFGLEYRRVLASKKSSKKGTELRKIFRLSPEEKKKQELQDKGHFL